MVWGGGYLSSIGVIDFAEVSLYMQHVVGALVAVMMLGPSKGFPWRVLGSS